VKAILHKMRISIKLLSEIVILDCPLGDQPCSVVRCGSGTTPTVINKPNACPTCKCGTYLYMSSNSCKTAILLILLD